MELSYAQETGVDYDRLFRHVEGLKKVLLVPIDRSGSDFFQSLLDGHPEILQFTGIWHFHHWWKLARCKENLPDLVNEFIWHTCPSCSHIAKFKSYYNRIERWEQLGDDRKGFFEVDIDDFKTHMLRAMAGRELNSKNFFLAVNLAYGLATKFDVQKTKILFYHIHHMERLKDFREDFADFDLICTMREPRNTLVSAMERWKAFDPETYHPAMLYYRIKRIFEGAEQALPYTRNIRVLKLEDLHLFPEKVLGKFCGTYGMEFRASLLESSYHGKKWWGDALSGRYLDGFNKKAGEKAWGGRLFSYDSFLIESIPGDKWRHYGYSAGHKRWYHLLSAIVMVLLPMRYELDIAAYNFKRCGSVKKAASIARDCLRNYISRVGLYYKFIWRKIKKDIFLTDYFYMEGRKI